MVWPAIAAEFFAFTHRVKSLGIKEVKTAYRSPRRNPFVEQLIGSVRRECLGHVIVLSQWHMSLNGNAPLPREVESPDRGEVIAKEHCYFAAEPVNICCQLS